MIKPHSRTPLAPAKGGRRHLVNHCYQDARLTFYAIACSPGVML